VAKKKPPLLHPHPLPPLHPHLLLTHLLPHRLPMLPLHLLLHLLPPLAKRSNSFKPQKKPPSGGFFCGSSTHQVGGSFT